MLEGGIQKERPIFDSSASCRDTTTLVTVLCLAATAQVKKEAAWLSTACFRHTAVAGQARLTCERHDCQLENKRHVRISCQEAREARGGSGTVVVVSCSQGRGLL